jgi:hypothetical protein
MNKPKECCCGEKESINRYGNNPNCPIHGNEVKAREWWISEKGVKFNPPTYTVHTTKQDMVFIRCNDGCYENTFHVIEKLAYDQIYAKLEIAREALERAIEWRKQHTGMGSPIQEEALEQIGGEG